MKPEICSKEIKISGIVQGVGFRPFVYSLASKYNLTGWVLNNSSGVEILVNGKDKEISSFLYHLRNNPPLLARIDAMEVNDSKDNGYTQFEILTSESEPGKFLPISPDVAICPDCLKELFNPKNRRFHYPFINCTNCGPRFSIIRDIPYDRPNTTMAEFEMCSLCHDEYINPLDRRFHAQPIACPTCGPQVWFESNHKHFADGEAAIKIARKWISQGKVLAIKGLGGFHLVCDATNNDAVLELRKRKKRSAKPFAVMMFDMRTAIKHVRLSKIEESLVLSKERPIVLTERLNNSTIASSVAPQLHTIGIMLPYTPLHYLLLEPAQNYPEALVMTSGNLNEEPIAYENNEALDRLSPLVDGFLMHNREIYTRIDDSVAISMKESIYPIRRARGYAPNPIILFCNTPETLSTGAESKNTFCLTRDKYAFVSQHIGDLENLETLNSFEQSIKQYEQLFRINPQFIACDLHPDYLSTQYALKLAKINSIPVYQIQHHHAHFASCLADNGWNKKEPVIGVCFDGTGLGTDGAIWGGEFLFGNYQKYERKYHLKYFPLPGGDTAIHHPARIALAQLWAAKINWDSDLAPVYATSSIDREVLMNQLEQKINTPLTSSMGRLFDAVSALMGIRQSVNYEAQAAIELESIIDPQEEQFYPFEIQGGEIDVSPLWTPLIDDLHSNANLSKISSRFHNSIVRMVLEVCDKLRNETGCRTIALSGGVWQNKYLLQHTIHKLTQSNFSVLCHSRVPTNDGGISLGQAMILVSTLNK